MNSPSPIKILNTVALVLLAAGLYFKAPVPVYICLGLLAVTVMSEWLTEKLAWLWMKLGHVLGYVNSRLILGIVFIFILTPLAFLYRIFRKDTLQLKRKTEGSYFTERNHTFAPKDMEQMW